MMKLKTCPFCGSEAKLYGSERTSQYWIECSVCYCGTPVDCETPEGATEFWNRRVGENGSASIGSDSEHEPGRVA